MNNADQTRWIIQISTKLRHIQLVPTTAPCCHVLSASGDSWFKMFIARVSVAGWRQIGYAAIRSPAAKPLLNAVLSAFPSQEVSRKTGFPLTTLPRSVYRLPCKRSSKLELKLRVGANEDIAKTRPVAAVPNR